MNREIVKDGRKATRRRILWLLGCLLGVFIVGGVAAYRSVMTLNFHAVTPGRLYRSAQMGEEDLRRTLRQYGIRTIINLSGRSNPSWYAGEVKVAKELGVKLVDIGFSADELPPPEKMVQLIMALEEGPYPILIHCWAGADRTGLACAVYRIVMENDRLKSALEEQLSWRYGHFAVGKERAMDEFFELYRKTGQGKDFAEWVIEDYPRVYDEKTKKAARKRSE